MDFEDTYTPRTLIRYIIDNKLASTHAKSRLRKRSRSSSKGEILLQSNSENSPTPRTLIRDVLKEKEAANSSIYIPRHRSKLRKSIDEEPTPAFKRRAIERKRSLRLSKTVTPETTQKDGVASASKNLNISSPTIPYVLRDSRRKQTTITDFAQGVKQIRRKRELASAISGDTKQKKYSHVPLSSQGGLSDKDDDETETEVWDSEGTKGKEPVISIHAAEVASEIDESKEKSEGKPDYILSPSRDYVIEKESEAETEVWESNGVKKGEVHVGILNEVIEKVPEVGEREEKSSDVRQPERNIVQSGDSSQSATGTETEVWDSEGFGTVHHLTSVDFLTSPITIQIEEQLGAEDDRRKLQDAGKIEETIAAANSEENQTSSLPETEIWESEVEREDLLSSKNQTVLPLSRGISEVSAPEEILPSLGLQKEKPVHLEMDLASDHSEHLPPSEDEVPESEENSFPALETLEEEEDMDEEILPVKAKAAVRPKRIRKKSEIPRLPSSLTKKLFQHYCGMKVSREALEMVESCCDAYFEQLTDDLLAYSKHAGRKSIEPQDVELLLRRQGFITNERSLYTLVEKYLPLEYRQEIIPMATAHNVIIPKN